MADPKRRIPFNYTSADDDQIIRHLFGSELKASLQGLEDKIDTGRSSRHLYRLMGDLFIIQRNPFLFQELVEHPRVRQRLYSEFENDLNAIEVHNGSGESILQVLDPCRKALKDLKLKIQTSRNDQHRILKHLAPVVGKDNIYFDPFNLTAHATDATDWRQQIPVAVLRPEKVSHVTRLIKKVESLGFHIIPRGAGTGLTGGATPLSSTCIMVNTEKLNRISPIEIEADENGESFASIGLEAGVITQDAMEYAKARGYVFATDPTSSWACTIGGNLAENAGGKTAVLYGTAIDNVLAYDIAMPDGISYTVKRRHHPKRKTLPDDVAVFDIFHENGSKIKTIEIEGTQLRKKGLGKDVTNKTLNGLFGIQKEGCDGIITAARFILYPEFSFKKTACIEFFGNDMSQAGQVIADICASFSKGLPNLMALEHFDEEYIKAIKYKTKTSIGTRLIAVLLVDMVANQKEDLAQGVNRLEDILDSYDKTGFSVAVDEKEAQRFWQDRKRLGAIAAHTNSFKLNEDIVLPINALAEFARYVDQYNIEEKKYNQTQAIFNIIEYLDTAIPLSDPELLKKRVGQAKDLAYQTRKKLEIASRDAIEAGIHSKNFYSQVMESLRGYTLVSENVKKVFEETTARQIVIATHMHAGDGNVHVNIPVLSNDREMMKRANITADKIMEKASELGGVVSGEHGIGITKFKHLDPVRISEFNEYRKQVDPKGIMNPNKLSEADIIEKVFTPSFVLLGLESRILKHGALFDLGQKITQCVRCGRCKPQCPVFLPEKNMFFHPRNKNLSIAALIEALLYISQRTQSTGFHVLKNIEQIADHCTICHKCFIKCPVNIDSGLISIKERDILQDMGFKRSAVSTRLTLKYLSSKNRVFNPLMRTALLDIGARMQRASVKAVSAFKNFRKSDQAKGVLSLFQSPVSIPHSTTLRAILPGTDNNQTVVLNPQKKVNGTVFYFPGCGSERVFSKISMASILLLLEAGIRVLLPPPFMCCAYPLLVNGKKQNYEKTALENIIILSQIRDMFQEISFDACIVSCGTCMESLNHIEAGAIFDAPVKDICEFVLKKEPDIQLSENYLYHAPCHDSLNDSALNVLKPHSINATVKSISSCCSEAGTMALSRPDITHNMLARKNAAIKKEASRDKIKMLTNCPSCIQGLGRHADLNITPVHLAQELARIKAGDDWEKKLKTLLSDVEIINF